MQSHRCRERLEGRLTDSDCSHHWRHNDRESHSTSDHQVPLVVGNIFAFIAVMDLTEREGEHMRLTVRFNIVQLSSRLILLE